MTFASRDETPASRFSRRLTAAGERPRVGEALEGAEMDLQNLLEALRRSMPGRQET